MSTTFSALHLPLLFAKFAGICLTTGLRQLKSNKPGHADVVQRLCYSRLNSLTRTTPAGCIHSTVLMLKSPQALCTPLCETLGANARLYLEDGEDEELPPSLWTSSVLKKRRKKMNKHKYKKRKRRDRYKTKLT